MSDGENSPANPASSSKPSQTKPSPPAVPLKSSTSSKTTRPKLDASGVPLSPVARGNIFSDMMEYISHPQPDTQPTPKAAKQNVAEEQALQGHIEAGLTDYHRALQDPSGDDGVAPPPYYGTMARYPDLIPAAGPNGSARVSDGTGLGQEGRSPCHGTRIYDEEGQESCMEACASSEPSTKAMFLVFVIVLTALFIVLASVGISNCDDLESGCPGWQRPCV